MDADDWLHLDAGQNTNCESETRVMLAGQSNSEQGSLSSQQVVSSFAQEQTLPEQEMFSAAVLNTLGQVMYFVPTFCWDPRHS
jgi:hypothetical protein